MGRRLAGLRAVLDGMRDGVIQLDTRGNILATNQAAQTLLGRADLVGQGAEVPRPEPMRRLELWQRTGFESSSFG